MSVYLFTLHTYRSWMPDNSRGFVQEGEGIQPPNPALAAAYRDAASDKPYIMSRADQRYLINVICDACERRAWRTHAAVCEPTHLHVLVSRETGESWADVRAKLKNIISLELSRRHGQEGRRWLSKGASRKRVKDRGHFDYLMKTYLPRHRGECWYEGGSEAG